MRVIDLTPEARAAWESLRDGIILGAASRGVTLTPMEIQTAFESATHDRPAQGWIQDLVMAKLADQGTDRAGA